MPTKKPPPAFEVVFERPGLYPEQIALPLLSRALSAVQRLASGEESEEEDKLSQEGKIGLLQVRRGSAAYQFTAPQPSFAVSRLRETGKVLQKPEAIGNSEYILSPVEDLSAISRLLDSPIVIKEPGKSGVLARIVPGSYALISQKLLISGETSLAGRVERVGGATESKCGLRVPSQARMLVCRVPRLEVARKLGQMLYQDVVAQGTASWVKTSWRVVKFSIQDVYQPKVGSAAEAIEALRAAGGKAWDKIDDPEAFLEEVNRER